MIKYYSEQIYPHAWPSKQTAVYIASEADAELKRRDDALAVAVEALETVACLFENSGKDEAYDMRCVARAALSIIKGSQA